jgi:5-methylcytosine-specific restriction endonuclease McrA
MGKHSTDRKKLESKFQYTGSWVRPARRMSIYLRDGFCCLLCGADLHRAPASWITLDHITPQQDAKDNSPANLFTCCKGCNCRRQNAALEQFASRAALGRVRRNTRIAVDGYYRLAKAILAGEVGRSSACG